MFFDVQVGATIWMCYKQDVLGHQVGATKRIGYEIDVLDNFTVDGNYFTKTKYRRFINHNRFGRKLDTMDIRFTFDTTDQDKETISKMVMMFYEQCEPVENEICLIKDRATNAVFCECHIYAGKLIELCTIDAPLNTDNVCAPSKT